MLLYHPTPQAGIEVSTQRGSPLSLQFHQGEKKAQDGYSVPPVLWVALGEPPIWLHPMETARESNLQVLTTGNLFMIEKGKELALEDSRLQRSARKLSLPSDPCQYYNRESKIKNTPVLIKKTRVLCTAGSRHCLLGQCPSWLQKFICNKTNQSCPVT